MVTFPETEFILACVLVGCMALMGLALLFVRAEHIERNWLVGLSTIVAVAISAFMLYSFWAYAGGRTSRQLVPIVLLSVLGFGVGWLIDYLLGGRRRAHSTTDATLGADLAD
jgi:amino acid transporter